MTINAPVENAEPPWNPPPDPWHAGPDGFPDPVPPPEPEPEGIVIDSITPTVAAQWEAFTMTVTGSGFNSVTEALWFSGASTGPVSDFSVDSDTQVTVESAAGMDVGAWNIGLDDGTYNWVKSAQAIVIS